MNRKGWKALEKFLYAVGVRISNELIGFVENDIGSPLYTKDVKEALMFNSIQEAHFFEDRTRKIIGEQRYTVVITYKILIEEIGTGDLNYTIFGEV